ncbi:MAG: L,D-transpeptidase [Umezawaea sp.]
MTTPLVVARDRAQNPVPPKRKKRWISTITIDLTAQTIRFEWNDKTKGGSSSISSGRGKPCTVSDPCADQDNENCTPTGDFNPAFLGGSGYTSTKGDHMSWYVDLGTGRGIGIHNSQPVLGKPASHGCIRVPASMARTINKNVIQTTVVAISGKAATTSWQDKTCPKPRPRK